MYREIQLYGCGIGVIQPGRCGPDMYLIICLCGGILGELTKRWLTVLVMVLGTSKNHGKAKV